MPVYAPLIFETRIKSLEDLSPESVVQMLEEVRSDIGDMDPEFKERSLKEVLQTVVASEYRFTRITETRIDLSKAKSIVDFYQRSSEWGCQSCINVFSQTVDSQDAVKFYYCSVREEDIQKTMRDCGYNSGFSPLVKKHYLDPCDIWKPRFSITLDRLLEDAD